jgi:hypothetical protein
VNRPPAARARLDSRSSPITPGVNLTRTIVDPELTLRHEHSARQQRTTANACTALGRRLAGPHPSVFIIPSGASARSKPSALRPQASAFVREASGRKREQGRQCEQGAPASNRRGRPPTALTLTSSPQFSRRLDGVRRVAGLSVRARRRTPDNIYLRRRCLSVSLLPTRDPQSGAPMCKASAPARRVSGVVVNQPADVDAGRQTGRFGLTEEPSPPSTTTATLERIAQ